MNKRAYSVWKGKDDICISEALGTTTKVVRQYDDENILCEYSHNLGNIQATVIGNGVKKISSAEILLY